MAREAVYSLPINQHPINRFLGGTLSLTQVPELGAGLADPLSADPAYLEQRTSGFHRLGMGIPNREALDAAATMPARQQAGQPNPVFFVEPLKA